jgi:quinol monooxygenase YgiN
MTYKHSDEVYCLSYFYAKPEHRENLINSLLKLVEPTQAEKGCLQYELLLDNEKPNFLIMLEKFTNQQALDEHEQQPYVKYFVDHQMNQFCEKVTWNVASEISLKK